ncbi:MAG: ABC transporter permease [Caulobacterales bacterium]
MPGRNGLALPLSLWLGGGVACVLVIAIVVSWVWSPYDPEALDLSAALQAPNFLHWLGTDQLGRDVASLLLVGAQSSVQVALIAVGIGVFIGVPLGLAAAALRGWPDEILMRTNDIVFAFPALILAILLAAIWGPGAANAAIAIGVFNVPVFARVTRGGALMLWTREFVMAARAAGKNEARISAEHILPNLIDPLIVQIAIQFSLGILAESALSYVGLGVQAPTPSWGRMLAESQTYAFIAPWLAIAPAAALIVTVLGLNLLGEGLRDVANHRERRL